MDLAYEYTEAHPHAYRQRVGFLLNEVLVIQQTSLVFLLYDGVEVATGP
jgi:hypothetical protein